MNEMTSTSTTTGTIDPGIAHPGGPAAVVAAVYASLDAGDLDAAARGLHPEVVLHVPGSHPYAGDHVGRDAVVAFIVRALGGTERVERLEVLDLLGGGDHAAVLCNAEGYRHGEHVMHNRTVHLVRVERGLVREIWFHNWDQAVVDAFWA